MHDAGSGVWRGGHSIAIRVVAHVRPRLGDAPEIPDGAVGDLARGTRATSILASRSMAHRSIGSCVVPIAASSPPATRQGLHERATSADGKSPNFAIRFRSYHALNRKTILV